MSLGKTELPYDLELEQYALGAVLKGGEESVSYLQYLSPDLFHDARNRAIIDAVEVIRIRDGEVDMARLLTELERSKTRETAGGLTYLNHLESQQLGGRHTPLSVVTHLDDFRLKRFALKLRARPLASSGLEEYELLLAELHAAQRFRVAPAQHISEALQVALKELDQGPVNEVSLGLRPFDRAVGARRGDLMLVGARTSVGKGLSFSTEVATPNGWTTIGEIKVGDRVFSSEGNPVKVSFVSETHHLACYEVEFSDGTKIVTDSEHRWLTSTRAARRARYSQTLSTKRESKYSRDQRNQNAKESVVTTPEILRSLKVGKYFNHAVDNSRALQLPKKRLLINPYVLGCWLGDGTSRSASITIFEPELFDLLESQGVELVDRKDPNDVGVKGLIKGLRRYNLCKNKHIPADYLRASETQRRLLLAGLLDTDGHVRKNGLIEFGVTSKVLAEGTRELIHSLGYRTGWSEKRVAGRCEASSTCYTITLASPARRVCLLRRKAARQRKSVQVTVKSLQRTIVNVKPVESIPTRCIQVESPDHLFLVTRSFIPTHNTVVGVNFCVGTFERGAGALLHSFEMNASRILKRLLSNYTEIENWKVQRSRINEFEKDHIARAALRLKDKNFWIRHVSGSWNQHLAAYEALIRQHPEIEVVVVDYLGLIHDIPGDTERHLQLGRVTRDLKDLAGRLNVLVIGLAQFNRKTLEQDRPTLESFRESGNLEQDCDIAVLLHAPDWKFNKDNGISGPERLLLDVAKHRDGVTGVIEVMYDRRYCRISELEGGFDPPEPEVGDDDALESQETLL